MSFLDLLPSFFFFFFGMCRTRGKGMVVYFSISNGVKVIGRKLGLM